MEKSFNDEEHKRIWDYLINHFSEVKQDIRELRNRDWLIAGLIIASVLLARLL